MLLVDRQESVAAGETERFRHIAYRLVDEAAVRDYSQLEFVFDSSYQQLILHEIVVRRGDQVMDQLRPERIRVVQRETRLEYQVLDGSLSAVVVLEGVRRGDIVEYSYSLRGENPVFDGHYMTAFTVRQSVPVRRLQFRLLWPEHRRLYVRSDSTAPQPAVRVAGGRREYIWNRTDIAPLLPDANLPSWYRPYPEIQLSDFASWEDVADWGAALFETRSPVPPELAVPLRRIRTARAPAERVRRALQFVQEEVRYLGIEIGVNSHLPHPPATVLGRRYGDCKDKTLLMLIMLRELGVKAWPALVSTFALGHVGEALPSATLFDHAIVYAEVDGRPHWLDPSALHQRGDLTQLGADFGAGLILRNGTSGLTEMADPAGGHPLTDIIMDLRLDTVGVPVPMRVSTQYRGRAAEDSRSLLRMSSPEELQKRYEEFYSGSYPTLRADKAPVVDDDEAGNMLHVAESYTIAEFWRASDDPSGYRATLEPLELSGAVPSPGNATRTMPLAVSHPRHIRYVIEAQMEQGWSIAPEDSTVESAAVRFNYSSRVVGKTLTLTYEYRTLADHVRPDAVADHMTKLGRIRQMLAFDITHPGEEPRLSDWLAPGGMNWPVLMMALLVGGLAVFFAVRVPSLQPVGWPAGPADAASGPTGLGGWLILVGIGLCIGPIRNLINFVDTLPGYATATWAALTTPGYSNYHPLWAPTLLFELAFNITVLVFGVLLVVLFFRRHRWFPALFVMYTVFTITGLTVDYWLSSSVPAVADATESSSRSEWSGTLGALLWCLYMFRSRRVKNTFVN